MEKPALLTYQDLIEDSSIPFNSLNTIKRRIFSVGDYFPRLLNSGRVFTVA